MQAVSVGTGPSAPDAVLRPSLTRPSSRSSMRCSSATPSEPVLEKRGWCLKKGKSDKPWSKASHNTRFFVSRSHALCYFEREAAADSELGGSRLLGLIDLREVVRVRPSEDPTAPTHALDIVTRSRTYTIVPQPPTIDEVSQWVRVWASMLRPGGVAPELRQEAGLPEEAARHSMYGSMTEGRSSRRNSFFGSVVGRNSLHGSGPLGTVADAAEAEAEAVGGGGGGVAEGEADSDGAGTDDVILHGFLSKMPVKSEHRKGSLTSGLGALMQLGELTAWRRRYCQLRPGVLQWYRDDPGVGGEFLGMLRLMPDSTVELDKSEARLRITAAGETLVLRDDAGTRLGAWEAELTNQVRRLHDEAAQLGANVGASAR